MITGGIKFFEPSQNLLVNGSVLSASSGNASSPYAIDRNTLTYWRSVSSDDLTTETLDLQFASAVSINRILLLDHNFKQFNIQYNDSGVWTNFSNVSGLDGSLSGISETTFSDNTSYYEFDAVTVTEIRIRIDKTQVVNAEKYLSQIICTTEIGTLVGYPTVKDIAVDRNKRIQKTLSGRYAIQNSTESTAISLDLKDYPSSTYYNADVDLFMTLHDRDTSFIVWLCGGRRGSHYFHYTLRGFRLKDAYTMGITKAYSLSYSKNIYTNQVNAKVELQESI